MIVVSKEDVPVQTVTVEVDAAVLKVFKKWCHVTGLDLGSAFDAALSAWANDEIPHRISCAGRHKRHAA